MISTSFSAEFRTRNRVAEERLAALTTFRIGGPATVAMLDVRDDLAEVLGRGSRWLGKGANLLVGDNGPGVPVVRLGRAFDVITDLGMRDGRRHVAVGAATDLAKLITHCISNGLAGPEGLAGVPATVGGALRMNAGTAHCWTLDFVSRVEIVLPGQDRPQWLERSALPAVYRSSGLPNGTLFLGCEFALEPGDPIALKERGAKLKKAKADSQPLALPSAGCVFKNPAKDLPAGKLIDELGLKGSRIGGAEISAIHGNFIVNPQRNATAQDVVTLVRRIRRTAWKQRGIVLDMEIEAWACPDELRAPPADLPESDA
ncbi:MAG: UDP-N-acetylmuramate dehydrogenase [Planctomycetota bacterium]